MPTVTVYPTSHTIVSGTWSNPTNLYADDGSYATISPVRNTDQIILAHFPVADLPVGAVITSVTHQIKWKSSRTDVTATTQLLYDSTARGGAKVDTATTTTDRISESADTGAWTASDLNSGLVALRINAQRSSVLSSTISVDYACIIVAYTYSEADHYKSLSAAVGVLASSAEQGTIASGAKFISASSVQSSYDDISIPPPDGYQEGDLLVLQLVYEFTMPPALPSGWTDYHSTKAANSDIYIRLGYKTAVATETAVTVTIDGYSEERLMGAMYALRNALPPVGVPYATANAGTAYTAYANSTTADNSLLMYAVAYTTVQTDGPGEMYNWANASLAYIAEAADWRGKSVGDGVGMAMAHGRKDTAGAVTTTTAALTQSGKVQYTLAFEILAAEVPVIDKTTSAAQSGVTVSVGRTAYKRLSSATTLSASITKTAIKLLQTITNISATAAKRAAKSFMHGLTSGASFAWTLIQDAVTYFKELSVGATAAASIRKNALKSAHTPVFCSPRQTKSAGKELQGVTQTTQQSAKKRPYKAITAETTITSRAAKFIRAFITSAITKAKGAVTTFPIRILRNVVLRFAERKRDLTVQEQSVTVNIKTGKIDLEVRE